MTPACRLADRHLAPAVYASLLGSMSPREAAQALGLSLGEVTPHAVAQAWRRSAGLGVRGHAAKDVLLHGLRLAEDEEPAEKSPAFLKKVEKVLDGVTLSEAMDANSIPSSVAWKMSSRGKEGSSWKTWTVLVGQAGGKLLMAAFYVMPMHIRTPNKTDDDYLPGVDTFKVEERWEARQVTLPPGKDLIKAVEAAARTLGLVMEKSWRVWPNHGLSEGVLKKLDGPVKGGTSLKEALLGSGLAKLPENRKTQPSVDLIFKRNRLKRVWDEIDDIQLPGPEGSGGSTTVYDSILSALKNMDIFCRIDGKEYKLAPETLQDRSMRYLMRAVLKRGEITDGLVYNLTRSKTDSPRQTITMLLDALTGEPSALIIALSKAVEFFDDKANSKIAGSSPRLAQLLPRFSAGDVAELTGLPLSTILSFEASHVRA